MVLMYCFACLQSGPSKRPGYERSINIVYRSNSTAFVLLCAYNVVSHGYHGTGERRFASSIDISNSIKVAAAGLLPGRYRSLLNTKEVVVLLSRSLQVGSDCAGPSYQYDGFQKQLKPYCAFVSLYNAAGSHELPRLKWLSTCPAGKRSRRKTHSCRGPRYRKPLINQRSSLPLCVWCKEQRWLERLLLSP